MPVRCHNRELFGPWLLRQINSNQYEGVYWLDNDRTLFRLPWKHLNIRSIDEKDYAIFKAWAIKSGKYDPLCEDLPTYKTNFRCALRAVYYRDQKMFSEFNDKSSDPHDPHKIFKFHGVHDDSSAPVNVSTVSQSSSEEENLNHEMEHDEDYRLRISPDVERVTPFANGQESADIEQLLRNVLLDSDENAAQQVLEILQDDYPLATPRVDQIFQEPVHEPNLALAEPYNNGHEQPLPTQNNHSQFFHEQCTQYPGYGQVFQPVPVDSQLQQAPPPYDEAQTFQYGFQQENTQHMINNEAAIHPPNYAYNNTNGEMSATQSPQNNPPSTFNEHRLTMSQEPAVAMVHQASKIPKLTSWEVTVFYRGKEVLKQNVSTKFYINHIGCVPEAADIVTFPPTSSTLVNQTQIEYTDKILNSVGNGLLLDVSADDYKLYATRMGNSRVYWGMSKSLVTRDNASHAMKLHRDVPTEIFDFNQFWQELNEYKLNQRSSPDYTLYLCFGQNLFEPIKKSLVLVKLVPSFCTFFHQLAQQEGASSLHNELISLQISNGSSFNSSDVPCFMDLDLSDFPDLV